MSEKMPQTYANHTKFVPLFHYVATPLALINLIWSAWQLTAGDHHRVRHRGRDGAYARHRPRLRPGLRVEKRRTASSGWRSGCGSRRSCPTSSAPVFTI